MVKNLFFSLIKNKIRANTNKNISGAIAEKKAIALIEASHQSYPAVSSSDVLCEQLRTYARRYQDLLQQKEQCIKDMVQLAKERSEYKVILSFPGIGPNTAVRLMAEIGDIHRFENNKQLNAYAGMIFADSNREKPFLGTKSTSVVINIYENCSS